VIAISAGNDFSLALTARGNVVAWGWTAENATKVPPGFLASAIAAGNLHGVAVVAHWLPSFLQQPVNQEVTLGDSCAFTLSTDSTNALTFQWYRNGKPVSAATNSSLTLSAVSLSDGGT
jgi:alpha-tubulin suppressor-like RCC1 family protein